MTVDPNTGEIVEPQRGALVRRQGFAGTEIAGQHETSAQAMAERAKAEVAALYQKAMLCPRNVDEARQRLMRHCKRPGFAERARYRLPFGETKVEGPSIRFVEAAMQEYGNVLCDAFVTYESEDERKIIVRVLDLERNIAYSREAVVRKILERKRLRKGEAAIGTRINAKGEEVFLVRASEVDLARKQGAAESKATRTLGLRILPADIVEEGQAICIATMRNSDAKDPDAAKRSVLAAFETLGILAGKIAEYLGHPLDEVTPAELDDLRAAYATIKEGEATWRELVRLAREQRGEVEADEKQAEQSSKLRASLDAKKQKRQGKTEAPTEDPKQ